MVDVLGVLAYGGGEFMEVNMISLTNHADAKGPILIAVRHIVSVRADWGQTFVLTTTGVEYAVGESVEEVVRMLGKDSAGVPRQVRGSDLSIRAQNCLASHGLKTDHDVREHVRDNGTAHLLRMPHIGRKTVAEIMDWLAA